LHILTDLRREVWGVHFQTNRLVGSDSKGELCLWDSENDYKLIKRMTFHRGGVRREALLLVDDGYIISGSLDCTIALWNANTGEFIREFVGHQSAIYALQYDSLRKRIISGSEDSQIRIWDLNTGTCLKVLNGHTALVARLRFREFDGLLVSTSDDGTVKVWDTEQGKCLQTLTGFQNQAVVYGISLFEDKVIGGGSAEDPSLNVWDIKTGERRCILKGHDGIVFDLRSDESKIVSAAADGIVRVWYFGD